MRGVCPYIMFGKCMTTLSFFSRMAPRVLALLSVALVFLTQYIYQVEAVQEELSVWLDAAQFGLNEMKGHYEHQMEILQRYESTSITDSLERMRNLKFLQQGARAVSKVLKVVSAASVLANVIFSFFNKDPTEALHKRFDEVCTAQSIWLSLRCRIK